MKTDGQLAWRTASERNADHWNIERSTNGRDFVKFAERAAQGTKTSPTDYALTDARIGQQFATVYYRLQEVDADGTTAYSPVQVVTFNKTTTPTPSFSLYPNPAVAEATLDLTALPTGTYRVTLVDMTGRLVQTLTLDAGLTHAVKLDHLASGSYLVLVQGTNEQAALRLSQRLVKE